MAEDELGRVIRAAPLQPESHGIACVSFGLGLPGCQSSSRRAYGGRGGREVNDMQTAHWKKARCCLFAIAETTADRVH